MNRSKPSVSVMRIIIVAMPNGFQRKLAESMIAPTSTRGCSIKRI
jgi:hypothetical protein